MQTVDNTHINTLKIGNCHLGEKNIFSFYKNQSAWNSLKDDFTKYQLKNYLSGYSKYWFGICKINCPFFT